MINTHHRHRNGSSGAIGVRIRRDEVAHVERRGMWRRIHLTCSKKEKRKRQQVSTSGWYWKLSKKQISIRGPVRRGPFLTLNTLRADRLPRFLNLSLIKKVSRVLERKIYANTFFFLSFEHNSRA